MNLRRRISGATALLLVVASLLALPRLDGAGGGQIYSRSTGPGGQFVAPDEAGRPRSGGPVEVGMMDGPYLTRAVRDLPPYKPDLPNLNREMAPRNNHGFAGPNIQMPPHGNPLVDLQRSAPEPSPDGFETPLVNFAGYTSGSSPPDDTGDVGPNYYIQGDNSGGGSLITIYDKSGTQVAQFLMETLAPGAPCSNGFCDPIVQYDELAGRWMISEFDTSVDNLCVYVSQTSDPLGAWYAYSFNPAGTDQDYPKYGVWWDGYYVGVNNGGYVHVLERQKMLNGQAASYQSFDIGTLPGFGFQLALPATHEGPNPPPNGAPGIFARPVDTEIHSGYSCSPEPCDIMEVWELAVDWNTPSNSTLTKVADVRIAEYDHTLCGTSGNWDCMPQPGTAQKIDPIREPLHFPFQYRKWDTYETLVGCFAEDVDGTDHAGVHWFEMRNEGSGWYMYQEGVLGGEAGVHRSVCSAAMDGSGNIAVGYTRTGTNAPYYPSIYYSGRLDADPLGTMPYYDNVIWDATNSKTNNERWGDYAGIGVDPSDDCTFWFTTEYGCCGYTRVAAFKFDQCGTPDFTLDLTPDSLEVCMPNDAVYTVNVGQINGYGNPVSLASSGRPPGTTEDFNPNPVTPPGSSTFTIGNTGASSPGTYNVTVSGTGSGSPGHQDTSVLNLFSAPPAAPTLSSPADGSTDVSTTPTFTWSGVAQAGSYTIEIAGDPAFATIVDSASGLTSPSYTPGTPLPADTVLYWRVRAVNACGTGSNSPPWAFRTEATVCRTYAGGTGAIRDSRTNTFDAVVPTGDDGTIVDVNLLNLVGTHTYISDLDFALDSPAGTRVQLIPNMCGSADDFGKSLDDEAANPLACPLNDGATQQPDQALSAYDGESSAGTWVLRITDCCRWDTGNLNGWDLEICTGGSSASADYGDLASGYGVAWHTGDGSFRLGNTWDADTTFAPSGSDDATDDGVTFSNFVSGQQATVVVNVQGTPANGRWLRLWFDWDGNGVFDDTERVYDNGVNNGDNTILVDVPAGLSNPVNYRARLYDSAGAPLVLDPNSYNGATGGEVEDGQSPAPTAVRLRSFAALPGAAGLLLIWETEAEVNNLGFHLYRSLTRDALGERLNDALIPSRAPGQGQGATYTFLDATAQAGVTYYYTLEDVDASGWRTAHGPVVATLWRAYLPLVRR